MQVLYLTEPIDEVAIQNLATFEGKQLVDVSKEDLNLGEDEEEKAKVSTFVISNKQCEDFQHV